MLTVRLLIKGKVQGVFFRATAKEQAEKYGIRGWVRNTENGDVESVASGDEASVQQFIDWCHKGPARAKVTEVIVEEIEAEEIKEFTIRR